MPRGVEVNSTLRFSIRTGFPEYAEVLTRLVQSKMKKSRFILCKVESIMFLNLRLFLLNGFSIDGNIL